MLLIKVTHCTCQSFLALFENFRSLCHPDDMGSSPAVDLAICVAVELCKGVEGQE